MQPTLLAAKMLITAFYFFAVNYVSLLESNGMDKRYLAKKINGEKDCKSNHFYDHIPCIKILLQKYLEASLKLRRALYGDGPHEQVASTMFNLGYIISQIPGVQSAFDALDMQKATLEMYMALGGPSKYAH